MSTLVRNKWWLWSSKAALCLNKRKISNLSKYCIIRLALTVDTLKMQITFHCTATGDKLSNHNKTTTTM